jgi:prepilin-type processing-associated H-X9-DG protein
MTRAAFISPWLRKGMTRTDVLVAGALVMLLLAILLPLGTQMRERSREMVCHNNLKQVGAALRMYAAEHQDTLPAMTYHKPPGGWWWYKEQLRGNVQPNSSPTRDKTFACPSDRGYEGLSDEAAPFHQSAKHAYNSYVFNGVNLPGLPNIAGRKVSTIGQPDKTLLVMEWTAHAPLSWHKSRTGKRNAPFYNNAESVVAFVDGHVKRIKIYYDGMNPAYTRDPIPGYEYKFSGD